MSRRDFRGRVEAPRPAAAWLMSIVASASLWITEQIPFWVIAVQCVAFATSYFTRRDPPAFRKSPIWLNVGMAGVTTVTIRSALDGNPATVSLALFTALAQALQLLDARPRKSEFVLVAVSLFQVILASNLTDSVFFPPLLVLFLVSVTWTLLIHTLQMEAAEAGTPQAAERAIAPDLRRMTTIATSICLVLALLLFVTLPRVKGNLLRGGMSGNGLAVSGFSDRVRLGTVGAIRQDHSTVLRVEVMDGDLPHPSDAYWRGLAFDQFDGRDWSISPSERSAARTRISGVGRFGITLRPETDAPKIAQRILREPVQAGVIFSAGDVERIEGPFQHLERDRNGGLYVPGRGDERIRYTIWSSVPERRGSVLQKDRAVAPLELKPGGPRPALRYLELPPLDPRVAARAAEIVSDAPNDFERARRLQDRLRLDGRYTDDPPPLGDEQVSPIEAFILGELEGHCEYFASAMVVLARSQGLPARLVNGFAGGIPNRLGGFVEVTRADAHAWVEIHFEEAGWVRFDPTPPSLRLRAEDGLSIWSRVAQLGSAVELWWFQRVVDFDSADQIGALRGLWLAWTRAGDDAQRSGTASADRVEEKRTPEAFAGAQGRTIVAGLVLMVALGWLVWRRYVGATDETLPRSYRRAQKLLARRGWRRDETTSARAFSARVATALPEPAARAFERITECYLAERFGDRATRDLTSDLALLEDAVKRMGLGNQTHVR